MKRIIGVFLLFSLTATTFAQTEVQYNKLTIEERAKYDARIDNEIKSSGDEVQTSVIEQVVIEASGLFVFHKMLLDDKKAKKVLENRIQILIDENMGEERIQEYKTAYF